MRKLKTTILLFVFFVLVIGANSIKSKTIIDAEDNIQTTEATTTTKDTVTEITTKEVIKVKKMKVKYKKTMTIGDKQKIKITKIKPKKATCKKVKIVNKTKKILSLKKNSVRARAAGVGKVVIKSVDGNYKKTIKIIVKKPVPSFNGIPLQYNKRYHITSNPLNVSMGVKYFNGAKETYYSQRVLPGGGLKIPGRHVADDGTIRDKDGYIVVSCNYSFRSKYSKFLTSLGPAKVYDTGCRQGVVDIYVNW